MSRKIISLALLLAGIGVLLAILWSPATTLSRCSLETAEFDAIAQSRNPTDEELITAIRFDDYALSFDAPGGRWFYSLMENSPTATDPTVAVTTAGAGISFAFENIPITDKLIHCNTPIRLIAYTDSTYREYSLVCTTLPILELRFPESIGVEETEVQVRLFDNRSGSLSRVTTSRADAHIRGNLSTWYPKKGYKLSLTTDSLGNNLRNNDVSLLGMRQENDWILNAAYNDQDRVRQIFSAALWADGCGTNNLWGVENSNDYAYVELFCNDEYWGLYLFGYPIDRPQLGINSPGEYLYKKVSYDIPSAEDFAAGPEIPGYAFGGSSSLGPNDPTGTADWAALANYYAALNGSDFSAMDLDNLIDTYLFTLMIQGVDNCGKNYYISAKNLNGDTAYLITPWDFDLSWGNTYDESDPNFTVCTVGPEVNLTFEPFAPLLECDFASLAPRILARYQQLRSGPWSDEAMDALLNGYENAIFRSGAYARDTGRWSDSTQTNQEDLSNFRAMVKARMACMDEYVRSYFG